jgi:hypothetical protein
VWSEERRKLADKSLYVYNRKALHYFESKNTSRHIGLKKYCQLVSQSCSLDSYEISECWSYYPYWRQAGKIGCCKTWQKMWELRNLFWHKLVSSCSLYHTTLRHIPEDKFCKLKFLIWPSKSQLYNNHVKHMWALNEIQVLAYRQATQVKFSWFSSVPPGIYRSCTPN